ncbi:hypothetical protein SETIT_9G286400v2 [Setaria italica]|uniref:Uncharacterized protein n=1 Tax=Setaria italica TaxID=4555 RepID=A0A368SNG2_SETIT|nr:hypothetical protein SETIT_9G286400v2 [Setaria italica]
MMMTSWNNFLQPLLHFAVVRSHHDERLVRIILPLELMLISLGLGRLGSVSLLYQWQKEEEETRKKEEDFARSSLQGCWSSFFERLFSTYLLSVCLCGLLHESLYMFEIEICSCMTREYNVDEVLCDMMTYSAFI